MAIQKKRIEKRKKFSSSTQKCGANLFYIFERFFVLCDKKAIFIMINYVSGKWVFALKKLHYHICWLVLCISYFPARLIVNRRFTCLWPVYIVVDKDFKCFVLHFFPFFFLLAKRFWINFKCFIQNMLFFISKSV